MDMQESLRLRRVLTKTLDMMRGSERDLRRRSDDVICYKPEFGDNRRKPQIVSATSHSPDKIR
jgi:hypothetical protein